MEDDNWPRNDDEAYGVWEITPKGVIIDGKNRGFPRQDMTGATIKVSTLLWGRVVAFPDGAEYDWDSQGWTEY